MTEFSLWRWTIPLSITDLTIQMVRQIYLSDLLRWAVRCVLKWQVISRYFLESYQQISAIKVFKRIVYSKPVILLYCAEKPNMCLWSVLTKVKIEQCDLRITQFSVYRSPSRSSECCTCSSQHFLPTSPSQAFFEVVLWLFQRGQGLTG